MTTAATRALRAERGDCVNCGCRPPRENLKTCFVCAKAFYRNVRRPIGWAILKAGGHRNRVRKHNAAHPEFALQEGLVDGPGLLARVVALGPYCGICGIETGYPWTHTGDPERGPEVDHILSMWAIIGEGRRDWASLTNVRLLCSDCHREEGVRLRRQDMEFRSHMDHMLGKNI